MADALTRLFRSEPTYPACLVAAEAEEDHPEAEAVLEEEEEDLGEEVATSEVTLHVEVIAEATEVEAVEAMHHTDQLLLRAAAGLRLDRDFTHFSFSLSYLHGVLRYISAGATLV